eukprot:IDg15612t1
MRQHSHLISLQWSLAEGLEPYIGHYGGSYGDAIVRPNHAKFCFSYGVAAMSTTGVYAALASRRHSTTRGRKSGRSWGAKAVSAPCTLAMVLLLKCGHRS